MVARAFGIPAPREPQLQQRVVRSHDDAYFSSNSAMDMPSVIYCLSSSRRAGESGPRRRVSDWCSLMVSSSPATESESADTTRHLPDHVHMIGSVLWNGKLSSPWGLRVGSFSLQFTM